MTVRPPIPAPPTRYQAASVLSLRAAHAPGKVAGRAVAPPPLAPFRTAPGAGLAQPKAAWGQVPQSAPAAASMARPSIPPPATAFGRTTLQTKSPGAPKPLLPPRADVLQRMEVKAKRRSMSARVGKVQIPLAAAQILEERAGDLGTFYEKPGGWEGWFQSELYLRLTKVMVPIAEGHVYAKKGLRADFVMTGSDGDVAIELKVESNWQVKTFIGEVVKDMIKVDQLGNGAILVVVARQTADEIASGLIGMTEFAKVGPYTIFVYSPS
jgi:hypothetical protein